MNIMYYHAIVDLIKTYKLGINDMFYFSGTEFA